MCCGGSSFHHRKSTLFDMFSVPRQNHPDVVSRYIRNISAALCRSMGPAEGQRALCANDSSIERCRYEQVGKQFSGRKRRSKSTLRVNSRKDITQILIGRKISMHTTAMLEIGHGNSNPGSLWPCGWDRSHDSSPEKLSCLPL